MAIVLLTGRQIALATVAQANLGLTAAVNPNDAVTYAQLLAINAARTYKRRHVTTYRPSAPATPDTAPDLSQESRLPLGSANAAIFWKAMTATLRTGVPAAAATTVQLYYAAGGNAVFGAGTGVFAAALTEAGAGSVEISTTSFSGTLATTGLAAGSIIAPQFSALGGTKVSLQIEWEEV